MLFNSTKVGKSRIFEKQQTTIAMKFLARIEIPFKINLGFVCFMGFMLWPLASKAQQQSDTLRIETSAICGMCKNRLETELGYLPGIKSVGVDLNSKVATVIYKPKKLGADAIRAKISALGYRADSIPADSKAFEQLPACCQAEGLHHP